MSDLASSASTSVGFNDDDGPPSIDYGLFILAVGLLFLVGAVNIRRTGVTNQRDPGPRVFPTLLATMLSSSGALLALQGVRRRFRRPSPSHIDTAEAMPVEPTVDDACEIGGWSPPKPTETSSLRGPVAALSGLIVCTLAMPWIGFSIAAFLFLFAALAVLGASWVRAAAGAAVLVVVVRLLFVELFHVVLPSASLF